MNGKQLIEWILHEAAVPPVDKVCKMVGKSRGECWGCPVTTCPRQVTPFEVAEYDAQTIEKAIQKLRSNQIWIGRVSGRKVLEALDAAEGFDHSGLVSWFAAALVEHRERFLLNQAVESARVGHQSIEKAAASVRYLGKDPKQVKNIHKFRRMVERDPR